MFKYLLFTPSYEVSVALKFHFISSSHYNQGWPAYMVIKDWWQKRHNIWQSAQIIFWQHALAISTSSITILESERRYAPAMALEDLYLCVFQFNNKLLFLYISYYYYCSVYYILTINLTFSLNQFNQWLIKAKTISEATQIGYLKNLNF